MMSAFTVWVATVAVITLALSWVMFWIQFEPFATVFAIVSVIAALTLVIMGLDEIIELAAMSMGF